MPITAAFQESSLGVTDAAIGGMHHRDDQSCPLGISVIRPGGQGDAAG